jgi:hypothetical protein
MNNKRKMKKKKKKEIRPRVFNIMSEAVGERSTKHSYLQPWVDREAAHHGVHAGDILAVVDFFKHDLLSIIPERYKTESYT